MKGSPAFLDTVGLQALWDRSDQWHEVAEQAYRKLSQERATLYTSALVLAECANAAARRPYRATVAALWREMHAAGRVFHHSEPDWEEAWAAYARRELGGPGVVDLISFRAMSELGIERAFTNDRHFRDSGFQTLF